MLRHSFYLALGFLIGTLGIVLFALNLTGVFLSLRDPALARDGNGLFSQNLTISYADALNQIERRRGETETLYLYRLTDVIHRAMAHYWEPDGPGRYNIRVPLWDNYLLAIFPACEFSDYHRALARGVGWCSQHAIIETGILLDRGITATMIGLEGHVVLTARVGGRWYVADPDFGLVLPFSLTDIEENPSRVIPYYAKAAENYRFASLSPDEIAQIYESPGNRLRGSPAEYNPIFSSIESISYLLKWPVPLFLIWLGYAAIASHRSVLGTTSRAPR